MLAIVRYAEPLSLANRTRVAGPVSLVWRFALFTGALVVLMAALSVEINRILETRLSMQQTLTQAALMAVTQLDGTPAGLQRARLLAGGTASDLQAVRLEFAPDRAGPWLPAAGNAVNLRCVRVSAQRPVNLPLLQLVVGGNAETVWTSAAAEQVEKRSFSSGLFPYAVIAHHTNAPSYGLRTGQLYTLRWPSELHPDSVCAGDRDPAFLAQLSGSPRRRATFLEVTDAPAIRRAFLEDQQTTPRLLGDQATFTSGNRAQELELLAQRIGQDTDSVSATYEEYTRLGRGNGRRLVVVPLRSNDKDQILLGTAAFFLLPAREYPAEASRAFCAEYAGSFMESGRSRAAAPSGYYFAAAVQ